jgi:hypothetical protein
MMNLIQVQDDLKNFSQDQLVKEMQQPSGSTPQFLVLAELNRRRRVKGDYEARQSQNQPTVAQEAIASAGVPQEGMMGMPEAMAPQSAVSEGVGTSAPMNMASGGLMQFGNEIRESMGQEIDPYLDGVQQEAEQKFNIDLDNQTGLMQMPGPRIPMLPQPFYFGHRGPGSPGTMQPINAQRPLPPQIGIGGKGAIRPAVMPREYLRGETNIPFGGQSRRFAEGGVVKAANGLSLADRNMNPGNIRPAGFMGETSGQGGYAGYASPEFGLRAMSRLSGTYANKGITTVRDFINRYAPPSDNNKNNDNYAKMVADSLGVGVDDPIDFSKPSVKEALIPAIAKFEGYTGDLGPNLIKSAVAASETEDVTDVNELLSGIDSLSGDKSGGEKLTADLSFPTAGNMGARNIDLGNIFGISSANASTESAQSLDDKLMAEDATDKLDPKTLKMLQDSGNLTELDFVTGKSDPNIFGKILGKQPTIKDDIDKFKDNRVDGGFAAFQDPLFVNRFKQKQGLPARSNQDVYSDGYGEQSNLNILDTIKSPIIKKNIEEEIKQGKLKEPEKKKNIFADKALQEEKFNKEKEDTKKFKEKNKVEEKKPESNYVFSDGSKSAGVGNTEQEIINLMSQLKKDRDFDKYMALAQVGLNLMDQKGYGEAAAAGLKTLGDSRQRYSDGVTSLINARAKLATAAGKTQLTTKEAYDKLLALRNRLYGKQGDMGIVNAELPADVLAALKAEERFLYNYLNSKGLNLPMTSASIETNKKAAG